MLCAMMHLYQRPVRIKLYDGAGTYKSYNQLIMLLLTLRKVKIEFLNKSDNYI